MNKIAIFAVTIVLIVLLSFVGIYYFFLRKSSDVSSNQFIRGKYQEEIEWSLLPQYIGLKCNEISKFNDEEARSQYLMLVTQTDEYIDLKQGTLLNKFITYAQVGKNNKSVDSDMGPSCWFILISDENGQYAAVFETDKETIEIVGVKNYVQETPIPTVTN